MFVWVVEAIKVELCQNFGTDAPLAPKFGTAAPPVAKLRYGKHVVSVCMGRRCV